MIKRIIKAIVTPELLASYAADGIQRGVNGTPDERRATVVKYATLCNETAKISKNLSAMLTDGNIDQMEADQLRVLLTPLFDKVLSAV